MLIAPTCYSQQGRAIIGKDTLYLVPVGNLRSANVLIAERDMFKAENGLLMQRGVTLYELAERYKAQAAQLDSTATAWQRAYETRGQALIVANQRAQELAKKVKRRNIALSSAGVALAICFIKTIVQ